MDVYVTVRLVFPDTNNTAYRIRTLLEKYGHRVEEVGEYARTKGTVAIEVRPQIVQAPELIQMLKNLVHTDFEAEFKAAVEGRES